jgi:hypothetical protein
MDRLGFQIFHAWGPCGVTADEWQDTHQSIYPETALCIGLVGYECSVQAAPN